jgi:hypothetical protein
MAGAASLNRRSFVEPLPCVWFGDYFEREPGSSFVRSMHIGVRAEKLIRAVR